MKITLVISREADDNAERLVRAAIATGHDEATAYFAGLLSRELGSAEAWAVTVTGDDDTLIWSGGEPGRPAAAPAPDVTAAAWRVYKRELAAAAKPVRVPAWEAVASTLPGTRDAFTAAIGTATSLAVGAR